MRSCTVFAALMLLPSLASAKVTLVQDGQAQCVIVVPARVMAADDKTPLKNPKREAEDQRQRLRESVKDLTHYLQKMSGGKVEVLAQMPANDKRLTILVGEPAVAAFGAVGKSAAFRQAFRVVVSPKAVGLFGESDLATSYAIYEILDRLGCRWYMPSELGEVIPTIRTITLEACDEKLAPGTIYRGIWYADDAYKRRNRMGGLALSAGHALEMYVSKEDRAKHPGWKAEINGKPDEVRLRWSNSELADVIASKILATHMTDPAPSYSLSPDDGNAFDESKEDRALDAGDFDTANQTASITDRLMVLTNRIAGKVTAKQPEVLFGVLAYVQYTRPPVREKLHPNVVPQIAPIAYSRSHPMTDDAVPDNKQLRALVEGWGKAARMTSMYCYAYFLAEPSAPQPMLTKWAVDVPIILKNNCRFWQPETMPNFENMMHAKYMANRLAWDPTLKPADVYSEINSRFYGNAAAAMTAYWQFVDDVWVKTPEYSGCGFGYMRRWTAERLAKARELLNAAISACKTPTETTRVKLADDSLKLFELFMKLRRDQAEGRFENLATEGAAWRKQVVALGEKYKDQYCFTRVSWTPDTISGSYFGSFYQLTYNDASLLAKKYQILTPKPLRTFRYQPDKDKKGESLGWARPEFDDKAWKTTDVCTETWSTLGHHDWFKSMWYRTEVELPPIPSGKKVFLWIGSTDGSAKVFVNGKHASYSDPKGKPADESNGYCQPASFDVSGAIRPGTNRIAVLTTRTFFNELGTGGLLAPVVIYREK